MEEPQKELEYLSDEALEKLIQDVESNHMMQAPAYLKTEILEQAKQIEMQNIQKEPVEQKPIRLTQKRKQQLLFYRLKVSMAAAAAILVLFLLPNIERQVPQSTQKKSITSHLSETSGNWCEHMERFSNLLISGPKKEIR